VHLVWVVALLLGLVPEQGRWSFAAESCCSGECCCPSEDEAERSCCERGQDGPVLVSPCTCGGPHAPGDASVPCSKWVALKPELSGEIPPPVGAHDARDEIAPRDHREAPEPPPPRAR
jgi:hypothetical protein